MVSSSPSSASYRFFFTIRQAPVTAEKFCAVARRYMSPGGIARVALMAVPRRSAEADDNARVLHSAVRIQKLCAHGAHVRPLGIAEHLADGVRRGELHIVVQQKQVLARGIAGGRVVDGGKVERPLILHHAQPPAARRAQPCIRRRWCARWSCSR